MVNTYFLNTGWGECRFIVVSTQNAEFIITLLFVNCYIIFIQTTIKLLTPHLVYDERIVGSDNILVKQEPTFEQA